MTPQQMLQIMRTLSALESWSWAVKEPIPSWLTQQVDNGVAMLEKAILEGEGKLPQNSSHWS